MRASDHIDGWVKRLPTPPAREVMTVWALVILTIATFKYTLGLVLPFGGQITGAVAVALFLWVPRAVSDRRGRALDDDGLTFSHWREDALFALVVMLVVFPIFVGGFRGFLYAADTWIPRELGRWLTPYGTSERFTWRAPDSLVDRVGGNIAVALAEEAFYRGYALKRFSEKWPQAPKLLGVPFGRAMLAQCAIFAAGHLITPQPFRLATFFPGLLFGWMAARSGRVLAPAIVHAGSNLLMATLEASAFGVRGP